MCEYKNPQKTEPGVSGAFCFVLFFGKEETCQGCWTFLGGLKYKLFEKLKRYKSEKKNAGNFK